MKLTKISYNSAVIFGVLSLIMYLVVGILQWTARVELLVSYGVQVTAVSAFVVAPIVGGIAGYLFVLVGIVIYNFVARKYPISWEVSKR